MSHKFGLQRVLDFKEQVEDLLQMEVAEIEGRRLQLQHLIDEMQQKVEDASTIPATPIQQVIDPTLVGVASDYLEVLDHRIRESGQWLEQVHEELEAKRSELIAAHQEREMLDRLK